MSVQVSTLTAAEQSDIPVIHLAINGTLESSDYDQFVPEVEQQIKQHGKIDLLVELTNFHGWTAGAMWQDTKFGIHHFNDIENLAVIGDKQWEKWLAGFAGAFTTAKVRYFDNSDYQQASDWVGKHHDC